MFEQRGTGGDEARPQREGAEDAGEKHPVLAGGGHGECLEEQREHEEVVDAECLLDQVGGEVLLAGAAAVPGDEDDSERGGGGHPPGADQHCSPHPRLAPVHGQVDGQQAKDRAPGCGPCPARRARHRLSLLSVAPSTARPGARLMEQR